VETVNHLHSFKTLSMSLGHQDVSEEIGVFVVVTSSEIRETWTILSKASNNPPKAFADCHIFTVI
jgi:hypothetical protein